jgi:hypothetical protein
MKLTLSQASELVGISRNGLLKAIKRGKVSAVRDDVSGPWFIDSAELSRVYPFKSPDVTPENNQENEPAAAVLTERVQALERLVSNLENERDDLRRRLDQESQERRQLMALLTHYVDQPKPNQEPVQEPTPEKKQGLLWRLLGKY